MTMMAYAATTRDAQNVLGQRMLKTELLHPQTQGAQGRCRRPRSSTATPSCCLSIGEKLNSTNEFVLLAERSLFLVEKETDQRKPITVRLGQPYWTEHGIEAACPVLVEGMLVGRSDIRGADLLDAVELAI